MSLSDGSLIIRFISRTAPAKELIVRNKSHIPARKVQALPERYRQAVYLRYYEGYEPAEIGTLMGCTASQVSTYLYRGKAKLRNMLGGAYGQECLSE